MMFYLKNGWKILGRMRNVKKKKESAEGWGKGSLMYDEDIDEAGSFGKARYLRYLVPTGVRAGFARTCCHKGAKVQLPARFVEADLTRLYLSARTHVHRRSLLGLQVPAWRRLQKRKNIQMKRSGDAAGLGAKMKRA